MTIIHRVLLTGGGTGGHVYPALAVAEELRNNLDVKSILYVGALGHIEERLAKERNLFFAGLKVSGLPRKFSPRLLTWPFEFYLSVAQASVVLKEFKPTVVLGTGGYASAPPLVAALTTGVPFAVHEPDAHPGLVNRMIGRRAQLISLGMAGAKEQITNTDAEIVVNGNPISAKFAKLPGRIEASRKFDLSPSIPTLLVTGGSQGAQALNKAVWAALPELLNGDKPIQVLHQVGENNWEAMQNELDPALKSHKLYKARPYLNEITDAYAACDLTVCRAGAMTIAELFVTGTPAIFVPLPSAAQDHQTFNAKFVETAGGARLLAQKDLTGASLSKLVKELIGDTSTLESMKSTLKSMAKPNAARDLATQVLALSEKYQTANMP